MQRETQSSDPRKGKPGSGVGGRIMDMLKAHGYQTSTASVDTLSRVCNSDTFYANPQWTISTGGSSIIDISSSLPGTDMLNKIEAINGHSLSGNSIYGETWSQNVAKGRFLEEPLDLTNMHCAENLTPILS